MAVGTGAMGATLTGFEVDKAGTLRGKMRSAETDPEAIVEAYGEITEAKKKPVEDKLEVIDSRREANASVQLAAMDLQEAIAGLQGKSLLEQDRGIFGALKPRLEGPNGTDGSTYMSVMPTPNADPITADISIIKLAEFDIVKGSAKFAATDQATGLVGTLTFKNIEPVADGDPPKADIVITLDGTETTDKLKRIVNKYENSTGIHADLIPSGQDYVLSFSSTNTAQPVAFDADISAGDEALLPQSRTVSVSAAGVADTNAAMGVIGTLTFAHVDGVSADITFNLDGSEPLSTWITNFNMLTDDTGVHAYPATKDGSTHIAFETVDNETPVTFTKSAGMTNDTLMPDPSSITKDSLRADIEYRGERSKHDTNSITLGDMNVTLFRATQDEGAPNQHVRVHLEQMKSEIGETVLNFVEEAKTVLRLIDIYTATGKDADTIKEELNLTDEELEKYGDQVGILRGDATMTRLKHHITGLFTKPVNGSSLANYGMKTASGVPEVSLTDFFAAYDKDPKAVERLFAYSESASDPLLSSVKRPNVMPEFLNGKDMTIELQKDVDDNFTATVTYPGNTGGPITFDVTKSDKYLTISPQVDPETQKPYADNPLRDFEFMLERIPTDDTTEVTIQMSPGIADYSSRYLKAALDAKGMFQVQLDTLKEDQDKLKEELEKIEETGSKQQEQIRARMYEALAREQALRKMLDAIKMMEMMEFAKAG